MNQFLKILLFFLIGFLVGACSPSPTHQQNQASFEEIRQQYSGEICNDLTGDFLKDCKIQCDEMYHRTKDRNKCQELELGFIDDLYRAYKSLKKADDLDDIDPEVFSAYINIDFEAIEALERIIKDYSSGSAKEFIFWLISEREIARVFRKADNHYNTLEALFKEINSNYKPKEIWESFTDRIEGAPLMESIIDEGEETADWFMEFINEKNPACAEDIETIDCFTVYCEIGDRLDEDSRDSWMEYERFEKYIDKIIDEKVNSQQARDKNKRNENGWVHEDAPRNTRDQIGDKHDFDEDWVEELCIGLI